MNNLNEEIYSYQKKLNSVWDQWNNGTINPKITDYICTVLDVLEDLEEAAQK